MKNGSADLDEILDFFQTIASLTQPGAFNKSRMGILFVWLNNYYAASEEYIKLCQKEYPQTYEGVEQLHGLFIKLENREYRHTKRKYSDPTPEEIKQFLIDESNCALTEKIDNSLAGAIMQTGGRR